VPTTKSNSTTAPPELKWVAQLGTSGVSGTVMWILTAYVFKNHLPATLSQFLPYVVGLVSGGVAGWMAKHTPRMDEIMHTALSLVAQAGADIDAHNSSALALANAAESLLPKSAQPAAQEAIATVQRFAQAAGTAPVPQVLSTPPSPPQRPRVEEQAP
jgi:hypothetical protein